MRRNRMAKLVMAEYTEAFDTPGAASAPLGGLRGGISFGRGGIAGVRGGGFVRAGGERNKNSIVIDVQRYL